MIEIIARTWALLLPLGIAQTDVPLHDPTHAPIAEGPAIYILERSHDLGEMREGDVAEAKFLVENRGTEDLVILSVRTTCGCTTVELKEEERTVKPFETREIVARFDSKGRVGRQHRPIVVSTNDPREPQLTLALVANVRTLFEVLPTSLIHLRSARRGQELGPFDVYPTDKGEVLEDLKVDVPRSLLTVRREPVQDDERGDGVRLFFTIPTEIELGQVNGVARLTGKVADRRAEIPMRVTGMVVGDLVARPALLQSLSPTPRGRRFPPITVSSTNDRPFEILHLQAGPWLDVSASPRLQNREYTISAVLREDVHDGPMAAEIVIRTNNTGQPIIKVPVFADVRPRCAIEPAVILLGARADKSARRLRLQAGEGGSLEILEARCEHPNVAAQVEGPIPIMPLVRQIQVALVNNPSPSEPFTTELVITTNIPGAETLRVPVEFVPEPGDADGRKEPNRD